VQAPATHFEAPSHLVVQTPQWFFVVRRLKQVPLQSM
jgi:hypothetical protein